MGLRGYMMAKKARRIRITLKYYPSPFEKKGRISLECYPKENATILSVAKAAIKSGDIPIRAISLKGCKAVVNGEYFQYSKWKNKKVKYGDEIIIAPDVQAQLGMAVLGAVIGGALSTIVSAGGVVLSTWVMMGFSFGGMLGAILFPTKLKMGETSSTTYSWEGITNGTAPEEPIPLVYGEHRMGGQIINAFIRQNTQMENSWQQITPTPTIIVFNIIPAVIYAEIAGQITQDRVAGADTGVCKRNSIAKEKAAGKIPVIL